MNANPTAGGGNQSPGAGFHGVLHDGAQALEVATAEPAHFRDLNLDQVVASVLGKDPYGLAPLLWTPLTDAGAVRYRQEVFRDLEVAPVASLLRSFADACVRACERVAAAVKLDYPTLRDCRFVDAAQDYCDAVVALAQGLSGKDLRSGALSAFRDHVSSYVASPPFLQLRGETVELQKALSEVRFSLLVQGRRVTVRKFDPGTDYGTELMETFARFNEGGQEDHRVAFRGELWMAHVQESILEGVARLYPAIFTSATAFRVRHTGFPDPVLVDFARDIRFYLAVLDYVNPLRTAGLPFCYPRFTEGRTPVYARRSFDLALAGKLLDRSHTVVCNDVRLEGRERVIVVTGPNQGGKTTFARMIGQLHYLASLGLPIPGTEAELQLPDRIFTHFARDEDVATLHGKLEEELLRVREILEKATNRSVIIMNESFSSTTLDDARRLGLRVLEAILERGSLCVYVTFIDELAALEEGTVSMVAMVDPEDPARRTFQIVRARADGRAYADAIARKYRLSAAQIKGRVGQ
jgi:DNA mismatch repair protein MutS